jgi:hypothetical protein
MELNSAFTRLVWESTGRNTSRVRNERDFIEKNMKFTRMRAQLNTSQSLTFFLTMELTHFFSSFVTQVSCLLFLLFTLPFLFFKKRPNNNRVPSILIVSLYGLLIVSVVAGISYWYTESLRATRNIFIGAVVFWGCSLLQTSSSNNFLVLLSSLFVSFSNLKRGKTFSDYDEVETILITVFLILFVTIMSSRQLIESKGVRAYIFSFVVISIAIFFPEIAHYYDIYSSTTKNLLMFTYFTLAFTISSKPTTGSYLIWIIRQIILSIPSIVVFLVQNTYTSVNILAFANIVTDLVYRFNYFFISNDSSLYSFFGSKSLITSVRGPLLVMASFAFFAFEIADKEDAISTVAPGSPDFMDQLKKASDSLKHPERSLGLLHVTIGYALASFFYSLLVYVLVRSHPENTKSHRSHLFDLLHVSVLFVIGCVVLMTNESLASNVSGLYASLLSMVTSASSSTYDSNLPLVRMAIDIYTTTLLPMFDHVMVVAIKPAMSCLYDLYAASKFATFELSWHYAFVSTSLFVVGHLNLVFLRRHTLSLLQSYGDVVTRGSFASKGASITFTGLPPVDGNASMLKELLALLDSFKMKATFFIPLNVVLAGASGVSAMELANQIGLLPLDHKELLDKKSQKTGELTIDPNAILVSLSNTDKENIKLASAIQEILSSGHEIGMLESEGKNNSLSTLLRLFISELTGGILMPVHSNQSMVASFNGAINTILNANKPLTPSTSSSNPYSVIWFRPTDIGNVSPYSIRSLTSIGLSTCLYTISSIEWGFNLYSGSPNSNSDVKKFMMNRNKQINFEISSFNGNIIEIDLLSSPSMDYKPNMDKSFRNNNLVVISDAKETLLETVAGVCKAIEEEGLTSIVVSTLVPEGGRGESFLI